MRRRLRISQIVADYSRKPLSQVRVLDLASLEGDFSAEFAMRGAAEVIGIEGRRTNIDKAQANYQLPNLRYVQDDVRNLSREKYGEFDVILCLGILYHLDAPDCFKFLEAIAEVCTGFAIFDTHVSMVENQPVSYNGNEYWGWSFTEFEHPPSHDEEEAANWAGIGNMRSFWPTKPSLVNAIVDAGFTSVYECQYPSWNDIPADRVALVALKNPRESYHALPYDEALINERVDETPQVEAISILQSRPK